MALPRNVSADLRAWFSQTQASRRGFLACVARVAIAAPVSALAIGSQSARAAADRQTSQTNGRLPPRIKVSKETTFLVGPLRADGTVDYLAALDEHCRRGVTPENNAAVPLWQAVGPKEIPAKIRRRFFQMLGIPELPEKGPYLLPYSQLEEQALGARLAKDEGNEHQDRFPLLELEEQFGRLQRRPWSKNEYPLFAQWLAANEKPLALVMEGSRRPRFYCPPITQEHGSLLDWLDLEAMSHAREVTRQLAARAMLRLHETKADEAWQDVLACHRMARLFGQQPFLIHALVSMALEGIACMGDVAIAHYGNLTATQAKQFLAEVRRLPPMPKPTEKYQWGERLFGLEGIQAMVRGEKGIDMLFGLGTPEVQQKAATRLVADPRCIDWSEFLRLRNADFDRLLVAMNKDGYVQRRAAPRKLCQEAEARSREASDPAAVERVLRQDTMLPVEITRQLHASLSALTDGVAEAAMRAESMAGARLHLSQLAIALAGFRSDHGQYPKGLSDLCPKHIPTLPQDPFTGGNLQYKVQGEGYLLYSCGPNGKDEGGRNELENPPDEEDIDFNLLADDIAIQTPNEK